MSALTERFPQSVMVDGVECSINSDFRTVLCCFEIQKAAEELSEVDLIRMLRMFYEEPSLFFTNEHVNQMFWFFSCGREKKKKAFPRKVAGINSKQPFDFQEDADLIYAGFFQQYGIDLQESEMHWWKFMILLENLGSDTRLSRVMEYRTIDTSSKHLSKEQRSFYKAMQRYYGLDNVLTQDMSERAKAVEEALLNGGDVSKILAGDGD